MTAAADMDGDAVMNQERNLDWNLYRCLRIVNVIVDAASMEVCTSFYFYTSESLLTTSFFINVLKII